VIMLERRRFLGLLAAIAAIPPACSTTAGSVAAPTVVDLPTDPEASRYEAETVRHMPKQKPLYPV